MTSIKKKILNIESLYLFIFPLLFGFWSYLLGQDRNADLINYHLYNAFSLLNNKLQIDQDVAGLHSYFNPLIDLPYFLLINHLAPELTAFLMGTIHGIIFILLFYIGKASLLDSNKKNPGNITLLLTIAGCLTPNFLAGLGNSMGDNLTALFGLSSLLLILRGWDKFKKGHGLKIIIYAGILAGFGVGLKLTNASYALALSVSLFIFLPNQFTKKIQYFAIFCIALFLGIFITGGFWFVKMWQEFQNPFFPNLSHIFPNKYFTHNPFSSDRVMMNFGPKNILEFILWPFISSIDYHRFGRGLIHQIIWPSLYILLIHFIWLKISKKIKDSKGFFHSKNNLVLTFIFLGYIINVLVFSIQRYMVTVEVLTPLALYLLVIKFKNNSEAWPFCKKILIGWTTITLLGGFGTYGHTKYKTPAFSAELPLIKEPQKSIVLIPDKTPFSWLVTLFDNKVRFIRVNFMDESTYQGLIKNPEQIKTAILNKRVFIMLPGYYNWRTDNVKDWDRILTKLNLMNSSDKCQTIEKLINKIKFRGKILYSEKNSKFCSLTLSDSDYKDPDKINDETIVKYNSAIKKISNSSELKECKLKRAWTGSKEWRYIWCEIKN
jgi:hypothetical protein